MPVPKDEVLELMRMEVDPAEVDEIRELWKAHSKAEDNRSIEGLLATLSEDCVYTVYPDDVSWHGHECGRFYPAPDRVPGHRVRAAEHRDRAAGRRRGGDRHRHAPGEVARQRADRRARR